MHWICKVDRVKNSLLIIIGAKNADCQCYKRKKQRRANHY
jgi:hypothetical protein